MDLFENGVFSIPGPAGVPVECQVLFTYDWDVTGETYVVFTVDGADQPNACRVVDTPDGGKGLAPLRDETERDFLNHCFEELKAQLKAQQEANE